MNLDDLFRQLQLDPASYNAVARDWRDSSETFPSSVPPFLQPAYLDTYVPLTTVSWDVLSSLQAMAARVREDPAWQKLAWHAHRRLVVGANPIEFRDWPNLDPVLGDAGGLFYLLIVCSSLQLFEEKYRSLNLPREYFVAGCPRVRGMVEKYADSHGRIGVDARQVHWMRHYVDGRIFRVGRFEYMFTPASNYNVLVYRHRQTGEVLGVCGLQPRGFRETGWTLRLDEDLAEADFGGAALRQGARVWSLPYDPHGRAVKRVMVLEPEKWEPVVESNDTVAGIHVPPGGGMTPEACRESLTEAFAFFQRYFPERRIRAAFCQSWIFNTQLETLLPESNLVRFMRELYLFPSPSSGKDGLYFIFGREDEDYASYPRDNSIRRALLQVLDSGEKLRGGGMFFLEEHLPHYGSQYYRTTCRAAAETVQRPLPRNSSTLQNSVD